MLWCDPSFANYIYIYYIYIYMCVCIGIMAVLTYVDIIKSIVDL